MLRGESLGWSACRTDARIGAGARAHEQPDGLSGDGRRCRSFRTHCTRRLP